MDRKLLDILCCPTSKQPLAQLGSAELAALNAAIAAGGLPEQLDLCFYRQSGMRVWVQVLIELDRRDGLPPRFVVLFRDITREREANERMHAAAQRANLDLGPTLIEANNNEIVYEITFDMPDDGLLADNDVLADDTIPANDTVHALAHETVDILTDTDNALRRYPT